jgi:hypothetical protein
VNRKPILNLGCGQKYLSSAVNVDANYRYKADVIHDLNSFPWPFADNEFSEVLAYDIVEHLDDVMATMNEIHRVSCHAATVRITVPHFSCSNAYTDPSHVHSFGYFSFDYFTESPSDSSYTGGTFRLGTRQIIFHTSLANHLVRRIANRYPGRYERRWAWLFPGWFLYFQLEVIKSRREEVGTSSFVTP